MINPNHIAWIESNHATMTQGDGAEIAEVPWWFLCFGFIHVNPDLVVRCSPAPGYRQTRLEFSCGKLLTVPVAYGDVSVTLSNAWRRELVRHEVAITAERRRNK